MKDNTEHRANEARRLIEEPLLREALESAEHSAIEEMLSLPYAADEQRRELAAQITIIRGVTEHLRSLILSGEAAQHRYTVV